MNILPQPVMRFQNAGFGRGCGNRRQRSNSNRADLSGFERNRQIDAKLFPDIAADPGMDAALAIEKTLAVFGRKYPVMPDTGVDIETLAAVAPERDNLFRFEIVAGPNRCMKGGGVPTPSITT
jgi:hypothetical protein